MKEKLFKKLLKQPNVIMAAAIVRYGVNTLNVGKQYLKKYAP